MSVITPDTSPEFRRAMIGTLNRWVDEDGGETRLEPAFLDGFGFSEEALASVAADAGLQFEVRDGRPAFWREV